MPTVDLVKFDEQHLDATYHWIADPELRWGIVMDRDVTPEDHRAWFMQRQQDRSQVIYAAMAEGGHIGNFGYRHLDPRHGTGDLWMYLAKEFRGRHLAEPMLRAGLRAGFESLRLRKISLSVRPDNAAAVLLYKRVGFVIEGTLRAEQVHQGVPVDMLRMALFAQTYAPLAR